MIKIELVDGKIIEVEKNTQVKDIIKKISTSIFKTAICAYLDNQLVDFYYNVDKDSKLKVLFEDDEESMDVLNHTTSHVLAQALKRLFKDVKLYKGPWIEEGFYYDFETSDNISIDDFSKIEKEMQRIIDKNPIIEKKILPKEKIIDLYKDNEFKLDIINNINEDYLSIYTQDEFFDLCKGPHLPSLNKIKAFKLLNVSGAYFKGDSKNKMLTRIYGTSFFKKDDLEKYINIVNERKERDHRKIGKELKLFSFSEYGPGFPFWLPKGMVLKDKLMNFWKDIHIKNNYKFIQTPIMLNKELWETSGHWFNYRENMYTSSIEDKEFAIKPMNCPGCMLVYRNDLHSYKDLPLKYAEMGMVHRHEASGALAGLFRVRSFTQDDAHIFMKESDIVNEIKKVILLYKQVYDIFNLDFSIELSTRPLDKFIGDISVWNKSEKALKEACISAGFEYKLNEGDGAFYGPKLDFKLKDSLNRVWQCGTIQLDMNLPKRFNLYYINENGEKVEPIMAHRALFGSFERFIGILTEHYKGAFPLWLSPVQIRVIYVNQVHKEYAYMIYKHFQNDKFDVEFDDSNEKLGYKIRESQTQKIPYTIIIGDNELKDKKITYRQFKTNKQETIEYLEFVKKLKEDIIKYK